MDVACFYDMLLCQPSPPPTSASLFSLAVYNHGSAIQSMVRESPLWSSRWGEDRSALPLSIYLFARRSLYGATLWMPGGLRADPHGGLFSACTVSVYVWLGLFMYPVENENIIDHMYQSSYKIFGSNVCMAYQLHTIVYQQCSKRR